MKRLITMGALLLVLGVSAPIQAQVGDGLDDERTVLREKLTFIEAALNDKAFDRILPLLDENVVVVFLNGEVARGIDQVRTYFEKTLGGANPILSDYRTKADLDHPASFVGDLALADGWTEDTFVFANGSDMVVHSLWTVILEKQEGEWKVLQLHFSSNIFDNPLVNSAKNSVIMFTIIGAVFGLCVGLFFWFVATRRHKAHA